MVGTMVDATAAAALLLRNATTRIPGEALQISARRFGDRGLRPQERSDSRTEMNSTARRDNGWN